MTKNEELANNNDMLKYLNENNPRKGKSDLKNLLKSQLKKYGKDAIHIIKLKYFNKNDKIKSR